MSSNQLSGLKPLAPGVIFALLAVLFGFVLGGAFGAAEESIKAHLNRSGEKVLDTVYQGDEKKKNAVVSKSWRYLKRAHIHGSAIGTAALGAIVVLSLVGSAGIIEKSSA